MGKRLLVAVMALLILGAAGAEAALEPHRAAYRLKLAGKHRFSELVDVRGGLVIEWRLACDGWLSRQRLGFVATTEGGGSFTHDVRYSSWEAADGSRLRYTVRSYEGDVLDEEYRGEARLDSPEAGGVARFTAPSEKEVKLPAGTVFPTEHMRQVLAAAAEGRKVVTHMVFDGWGFDALTQITTVIGAPRMIKAFAGDETAGKGDEAAWPISMAYYNVERGGDLPEFEASFLLRANGVLRDLVLDYGDFRLDAKLDKLELLERPDC